MNADQAHRILCRTSVFAWSTYVIICPKYFTFPSRGSISTCISPISISLNLFVFWFVKILVLLRCISRPCASVLFLKSSIIFGTVSRSSPSRARRQRSAGLIFSLFFITHFDAQAHIFPSFDVFSIADWRTELQRRLLKGSPCFVPRTTPNSSLSTPVSTVAR